jgi:hypothetical protein
VAAAAAAAAQWWLLRPGVRRLPHRVEAAMTGVAVYVAMDELERLSFEYGVPIHIRQHLAFLQLGERTYATRLEELS